jgi:phosphatidylinositol glycan class V
MSVARLACIASASRLGLLVLCIAADALFWDHIPDVTVAAYVTGSPMTRAFTRWDSARFLSLIDSWYGVTLDAYAFFPGFPAATRALKGLAEHVGGRSLGTDGSVICGLFVSNAAFVLSVVALKFLTQEILLSCPSGLLSTEHARSHENNVPSRCSTDAAFVNITLAAYVLNPASVFFVTNYSESLFACLTFTGMLHLERHMSGSARGQKIRLPSLLVASFFLAAATFTRSNGILACVLVVAQPVCQLLRRMLELARPAGRGRGAAHVRTRSAAFSLACALSCAAIVSPYFGFQLYGYGNVCPRDLASSATEAADECRLFGPLSFYAYIQQTGWNNGLFRYWRLRQIPNFLLASPMFVCTAAGALTMLKASTSNSVNASSVAKCSCWDCRLGVECTDHGRPKPGELRATEGGLGHTLATLLQLLDEDAVAKYFVQWFLLAAFILLCGHVQIVTRAVCASSPALYWFVAEAVMCRRSASARPPNRGNEAGQPWSRLHWLARVVRSRLLLYRSWCVVYICLGIVLHCNSLPWT